MGRLMKEKTGESVSVWLPPPTAAEEEGKNMRNLTRKTGSTSIQQVTKTDGLSSSPSPKNRRLKEESTHLQPPPTSLLISSRTGISVNRARRDALLRSGTRAAGGTRRIRRCRLLSERGRPWGETAERETIIVLEKQGLSEGPSGNTAVPAIFLSKNKGGWS